MTVPPLASSKPKRIPKSQRPATSRQFTTRFLGSFVAMDQLPRDKRPQVALAGRSNVGKSSLLNRLVGLKKMAKVSSTPGKTRALNFFLVNDRFYLVDLPGYGYAKVAKSMQAGWGKLIEGYLTSGKDLAGLVLLLDSRRDPTPEDLELLSWLAERQLPAMVVITKIDKVNRDQANRKVKQTESQLGVPALPFSALTGEGKPALSAALRDLIDTYGQRPKADTHEEK